MPEEKVNVPPEEKPRLLPPLSCSTSPVPVRPVTVPPTVKPPPTWHAEAPRPMASASPPNLMIVLTQLPSAHPGHGDSKTIDPANHAMQAMRKRKEVSRSSRRSGLSASKRKARQQSGAVTPCTVWRFPPPGRAQSGMWVNQIDHNGSNDADSRQR